MNERHKQHLVRTGLVIGLASFLILIFTSAITWSDNTQMCLMCHSMDKAYTSMQKGRHKYLKCTECHAPHETYAGKVVYKMKSGLRDLYATVTGQIPEVIEATEQSKSIIRKNCADCHRRTLETIHVKQNGNCNECHSDVAHVKS